jgi:hypothetical protein
MKKYRQAKCLIMAAISLCALPVPAIELIKKDDASFSLGGRFQLLGVGQRLSEDSGHDSDRMYLFLKQARIIGSGTLEDYKYYVEWAMGGEEAVKNLNSSTSLLDFRADIPVNEQSYIRLGQFKVPFGRESLIDDGALLFTDRSINHLGSMLGRDVGVAGVIQRQGMMGTLGVFTGGGRDNPERYLPEQLGIPLFVTRIGYDSSGQDPYNYKNSGVFLADEKAFSAFLNLAYMEDTRIGHSSVLNVRPTDRSLLLNPNWNPFLTKTPLSRSKVAQVSADIQSRFPVGVYSGTAEMELTHDEFSNEFGKIGLTGGRIMGSASLKPFEVALRYAVLYPSKEFSYKGTPITGGDPFQEITAALTYFHRPWSRFTFEALAELNTPVAVETGIGSYALVEQPDQTTLVDGKGTIERQFVPEVRLLYQMAF